MTPARWEWDDDDSPLIADEDMMEDEGDERNGKSVVGVVAGEVVRVEDGDDEEVEGSADTEVGVAIMERVRTDPELVGRDQMTIAPEDEPPKTRHVPRISFCIPSATPLKTPAMAPKTKYSFIFLVSSLLKKLLFSGSSGSADRLPSLNDWAETMSNLECKCSAVDGLPNHSATTYAPLSVTPSTRHQINAYFMHHRCLCDAREREVDDGKEKKDSSDCLVPTHFRRMRDVEKMMSLVE
jgi:hypothetical protein